MERDLHNERMTELLDQLEALREQFAALQEQNAALLSQNAALLDPFHEDVVDAASTAVHAEGNPSGAQQLRESFSSELGALVGVEDVGLGKPRQGVFDCIQAEARVHGIGQPPREYSSAETL